MLAAAVGLVLAGVATALVRAQIDDGAHRGMSAPLVDTCTLPDAPAPCDGAPITGTVEYRQDDYGALIVRVTLANARPSSEYPVLLNDCGSRDVTTCGTILVGSVDTDERGAGAVEIVIALDVLRAAPFGLSGEHSARVSLTKPGSVGRHSMPGVLSAGGVAYAIPR